ncbi:dynamin family protein [Mammaliicoccus sciuri]|uniref:dynamin family protein n=1 Tax=Mammaliicoccus sciuri TaxID=1296 RepID=UPI0021D352B9|nr:dynamin family protein [Mammaliicoccus sciuri]UXU82661.1 dynamin family protein [Mammaliicoccus sciuri]UXU92508.1 dynamin family protein [Mammaliicoccus sciuri]UXV14408.1 dynamin family protein [Mammaliicoccus sciuri]UXV22723.1 dynamin family protein [Mammaliicoccus sciuri]UXV25451.1 dynamin family protein [Mammaliicoccus sciuri]
MDRNQASLDLLYKLKKEIEKSSNQPLIKQINEMIKKIYNEQYTVSFVGHFSAGKSTLINNVIGQNILPSSPVPTTSNTAQLISSDKNSISVNLNNNQYTVVDNQEDVKRLNTEDREVESIEIEFTSDKFNKGFTFQDTPGVDSMSDNHRESAFQYLLTSNYVFYTVDYNHVQSDMNFNFIKSLNKLDIPVILVVNQVDKHDEDEISFDTYKNRVNKAVTDWKLNLEKIFYVSKYDTPNNEKQLFNQYIHQLDQQRTEHQVFIDRVTNYIKQEQLKYINQHMETILSDIDSTEETFDDDYQAYKEKFNVQSEQLLIQDKEQFTSNLKEKRKEILDNAYLMPYEMRETIRQYLETTAKDYKVKGLFNKDKKKAMIQDETLEQVKEALDIKIHDEITKVWIKSLENLNKYIQDADLFEKIINQQYTISKEELSGHVQEQTSITNDYVLIYSKGITEMINRKIRNETNQLIDEIVNASEVHNESNEETNQLNEYESYVEFKNLKTSLITNNYQHYYIHLDESIDKLIDRHFIHINDLDLEDKKEMKQQFKEVQTEHQENNLQQLKNQINHLKKLPLFEGEVHNIESQVERIEHNITKIAVFGTFSAGKSSLINAILQKPVLLSSPNPTTASITEISYGTEQEVSFKSYAQLLEEINHITEFANKQYSTIESFIEDKEIKQHPSLSSNHLAFFEAIETNFNHYKDILKEGKSITFDIEELEKLTADDTHAAFVHKINLRLEEAWLKDKIIIDSPGLNSNNQRHTRETEQIIASSDLIIYVSYYNHAFTDKDGEFLTYMRDMNNLQQSQGLKFVINAIDLAESEEDKEAVISYVESSLDALNIKPECYPVSSKQALKSHDDEFKRLMDALNHFVKVESKQVLKSQVESRIKQLTNELEQMVHTYRQDKAQLEKRKSTLLSYKDKQNFTNQIVIKSHHQLEKEIHDQLYYLKDRLNIQLNDIVKKHFNTSTVTDQFKQSLQMSTKYYVDDLNQKLILESSLIVERLKNFYARTFDDLLTPTIVELNDASILISKFKHDFENEINPEPISIQVQDIAKQTISSVSKKDLIKTSKVKETQNAILNDTMKLIDHPIVTFNEALTQNLAHYDTIGESYIDQYNQETIQLIDDYLSVNIDNDVIEKIENVLKEI